MCVRGCVTYYVRCVCSEVCVVYGDDDGDDDNDDSEDGIDDSNADDGNDDGCVNDDDAGVFY